MRSGTTETTLERGWPAIPLLSISSVVHLVFFQCVLGGGQKPFFSLISIIVHSLPFCLFFSCFPFPFHSPPFSSFSFLSSYIVLLFPFLSLCLPILFYLPFPYIFYSFLFCLRISFFSYFSSHLYHSSPIFSPFRAIYFLPHFLSFYRFSSPLFLIFFVFPSMVFL